MTRDSLLLIVGVLAGLVLFLTGTKPFMEWGYYDWLAAAGYILSVVSAQLGSSPLKGKTKPDSIADPNRLGIGVFLAVFLLAGQTGCASTGGPKHVITTADTALYESIKAISAAEITLTSAGVLSPDQSREINKKLLPVARTGKELNDVLSTWNGKAPMPKEIPKLVKELSDLLLTVSAVIPDSPAKASLVEAIARAQQAALALTLLIGG